MQIALKSRLGNCAFAITLEIIEAKLEAYAKLAGTHLVFHNGGSKAFNEKSGFTRDSAYSPELADNVKKAISEAFGDNFKIVSFASEAYVKTDRVAKMIAELEKLGMKVSKAELEAAGETEAEVEAESV